MWILDVLVWLFRPRMHHVLTCNRRKIHLIAIILEDSDSRRLDGSTYSSRLITLNFLKAVFQKFYLVHSKYLDPGIDLSLKVSVWSTTLFSHFFLEIFSGSLWNMNKSFDSFYLSNVSCEFLHSNKLTLDPTHQKSTCPWQYGKGQVEQQDGVCNCFQIIKSSPIVWLPSFIRNWQH